MARGIPRRLAPLLLWGALGACSLDYLPLGGARDRGGEGRAGYREVILGDRPLAYWRLADRQLPTARDEVGQHDGLYAANVMLGAPGAMAGGSAARFDLATPDSFMTVQGSAFRFLGNAPFTVEAWIQAALPSKDFLCPLNNETVDSAGAPVEGWALVINPSSQLILQRKHGSTTDGPFAALAPGAGFAHVAGTYDGGTLGLYVNGELQASANSTTPLDDRASDLVIGGDSAGHSCFTGDVADVAIYGRALGAADLQRHYGAR